MGLHLGESLSSVAKQSMCLQFLHFLWCLAEGQLVGGWKIPTRKSHTFSCYFRADRVVLRTQRQKIAEWSGEHMLREKHKLSGEMKMLMDVKL